MTRYIITIVFESPDAGLQPEDWDLRPLVGEEPHEHAFVANVEREPAHPMARFHAKLGAS